MLGAMRVARIVIVWIVALLPGIGSSVATAQASVVLAAVETTSRIDFKLHTHWGQVLQGRFPDASGEVVALADGRRQVRIVLPAGSIDIVDHPHYTRFARGPGFFDAAQFPQVQFLSDPYAASLLITGGELHGRLRMHGIERREHFTVLPASCARPGRACPIIAQGTISCGDYDLDGWRIALRDEVQLSLQIHLRDVAATQPR